MAERTEEKKDKDADNEETKKKEEKEEEEVVPTTGAAKDKEASDNQKDAVKEGEEDTKKEVIEGEANGEVKPEKGTEDNQESEDKEDEEAKGDAIAVGCIHCGKPLFNELTANMSPAVFMTTWPVSDGEEEDGVDEDMEADAEEQGEEGDATEKVWGQQSGLCQSKNSRLLKKKCCISGQRWRERGGGEPAVGLGDARAGQSHLHKVSTVRPQVSVKTWQYSYNVNTCKFCFHLII